jgi:hypothetical protein
MADLNNPFALSGDYFSTIGSKNNPFVMPKSAGDALTGKPMNLDSSKPTMGMPQSPKQQPLTPDPVADTFTKPKQADGTFGALGGGTQPMQLGMPAVTQNTVPAQVPGQPNNVGAPNVTPPPQAAGLSDLQQTPDYQTRPVQTGNTPPGLIAGAMTPAQSQETKIQQQQVANTTLTPLQASNKFQSQAQIRVA